MDCSVDGFLEWDWYTSLMFLNAGKLKKTVEDGTQGKGKGKVVGI